MRLVLVLLACWIILWRPASAVAQLPPGHPSAARAYERAKLDLTAFEQAHGHYLQTRNVRLHYLTWGNPRNPALVWSHGSFLSAYELLPLAERFVRAGFYVVAIDYYGHGLTPLPARPVSLYHVADDIRQLLDHLHVAKAFVGGFSRGGYISAAFYDAYPQRVRGLILEDGGSVASNTAYARLSPATLAARAAAFDSVAASSPWQDLYPNEQAAFERVYSPADTTSQFEVLTTIKPTRDGRYAFYPGLLAFFHLQSGQQFLDLVLRPTKAPLFAASMVEMEPQVIFRNLAVPLLILDPYGAGDENPVERENQALQRQHPALITYRGYLDAPHNIHAARPDQFFRDVLAFLTANTK